MRPWRVIASRVTFEDRWLKVRSDRCEMPDGRIVDPYHVIELPDWVNVMAVTAAGDIVLVREYRHGAGAAMIGLPSGTVEAGDASALEAARRELLEETGYGGGDWTLTRVTAANTARQNNSIHCFMATGVAAVATPRLDDSEQIETFTLPLETFLRQAGDGTLPLQAHHLAAVFAFVARSGRLA